MNTSCTLNSIFKEGTLYELYYSLKGNIIPVHDPEGQEGLFYCSLDSIYVVSFIHLFIHSLFLPVFLSQTLPCFLSISSSIDDFFHFLSISFATCLCTAIPSCLNHQYVCVHLGTPHHYNIIISNHYCRDSHRRLTL